MEMFDNDDTLTYEPSQTAAIVLTGGDEEAEAAALEVHYSTLHSNSDKQESHAGRVSRM